MKKKLAKVALCLPAAVLVWLPLWMLIGGALMGSSEVEAALGPALSQGTGYASWPLLPQYPTLQPLVELLLDTPVFFVMFWNSCKLVFPILAGHLIIGAPAAWALTRFHFKGRSAIGLVYLILMLLPFQVTMVSSYLIMDATHLLDSRLAVILPGIFSTFPVFIMMRFFSGIPETLLEAARLDGAGNLRCFTAIGLPLGVPGILSALVLGFLEYWSVLEQPLAFFRDKSLWPLALYLPSIAAEKVGVSLAASLIMLLPALLIFLFGQHYLEQGIIASGIKE